ncbi:zinc-binding dehydrogenase, partial [Staphylococcus sp. SIMBA_130]
CLIDFADIQKDEKVLIHAGAGGVGSFAIQLAKYKGAYVATTASGKNIDYLKSLGADKVINYREQDFSEELEEYDVVLD